jgi:hypothetical protein
VCRHEKRGEIESASLLGAVRRQLTEEYGLADRSSVYRHAHALGLFESDSGTCGPRLSASSKRRESVDVTAAAVVSAVQAYSKINAAGEWIDRTETVSMNDLFDRMSSQELEHTHRAGICRAGFAPR